MSDDTRRLWFDAMGQAYRVPSARTSEESMAVPSRQPARDIYQIAREIADEALATAHCAGYEVKPERDLFIRSDVSNLADAIADWLERHMRPASGP